MEINDKTELLAIFEALTFYCHVKESYGQKYSAIYSDLRMRALEELKRLENSTPNI